MAKLIKPTVIIAEREYSPNKEIVTKNQGEHKQVDVGYVPQVSLGDIVLVVLRSSLLKAESTENNTEDDDFVVFAESLMKGSE